MIKPDPIQMDELTGLFTRKTFLEQFQALLQQAKGSSGDHPLTLAFIDTDRFKTINDAYGHAAGDAVLLAIASTLEKFAPTQALGGRYGGDEFVLLIPGAEREQAFLTLEQVRQEAASLALQAPSGQQMGNFTISVGIAAFPVDGRSVTELMRKADHALYKAKMVGRNQVRLAFEERMVPKTAHFTQTQLERLAKLAAERQVSEADLLREAVDELLTKYGVDEVES